MDKPPLVARPRPPRSRSGRVGSSQSSSSKGSTTNIAALDAFLPLEREGEGHHSTKSTRLNNASHLALIGALETLTPPATPPMDTCVSAMHPESSQSVHCHLVDKVTPFCQEEQSVISPRKHARENSREDVRTSEELEIMLEEARRIIRERETELSIAASIGKSLLDSNIALRAKQDALLQRVQQPQSPQKQSNSRPSPMSSPSSVAGKTNATQPSILTFSGLHIPKAYGAQGELVEGRPPPSPRASLGRSTSRSSVDLRGDLVNMFTHQRSRTASNASTSAISPSVASMRSPPSHLSRSQRQDSPLRRSQGHRRRSSSSSTLGHNANVEGLTSMSRSSSTKSIAELHNANQAQQRQLQFEIQRLRLSEQNAELESKLQELEDEVNRADVSGKKKLRRLDKELEGLKTELESALERNKELEERLQRRANPVNDSTHPAYQQLRDVFVPEVRIRTDSGNSASASVGQVSIPPDTDTDFDNGVLSSELSIAADDNSSSASASSLPPVSTKIDEPEFDALPTDNIVSQLLAKINELQEANSQITAHKETLNERLAVASDHFEEMKRKYDFLEERVIEAEIRNHRILELEDGETLFDEAIFAIEWPSSSSSSQILKNEADSISPATKLKRKAVGNRPRIEQYRRMSSLYGSQARSELLLDPTSAHGSPPRRGTYGPANSRDVTPQKPDSLAVHPIPRSSSVSSRLSVSPARSTTSTTSKGRSRAGSFFDTEPPEDIITAMQRKLREQKEAFEREQAHPLQDSDEEYTSDPSSPHLDVFTRHRHHSLASEIGGQWGSPVQDREESAEPETGITRSVSLFAFKPSTHDKSARYPEDDDDDDLSALIPSGPADAQAYDDLQAALQDVAVRWEDDLHDTNHSNVKRIAGGAEPSKRGSSATIPWVYEDAESDNSDNDPWKEEQSNQHAVESVEQVQLREKAEARILKRRKRLEQLARQLLEDDEAGSDGGLERRLALVRVSSNDSQDSRKDVKRSSSEDSLTYEDISTTKRPGGRGTDYWPVSYKARYSPNVVAMRVQKTSQEYLNMCLLWTKFLVVLAVAVIFSIWKGPEAGLGIRSRPRRRVQPSEVGNTASQVMLRRRRD